MGAPHFDVPYVSTVTIGWYHYKYHVKVEGPRSWDVLQLLIVIDIFHIIEKNSEQKVIL